MFSIKRYFQLVGDEFHNNSRSYLLAYLASIGVVAAIVMLNLFVIQRFNYENLGDTSVYWRTEDPMISVEQVLFIIAIFITSFVAASMVFSPMKSRPSAISFLMLPASQLEKYLARLTVCVVIFPLAYAIGLQVLDIVRFSLAHWLYGPNQHIEMLRGSLINPNNPSDWFGLTIIICFFLALQAFATLGSSIWPKRSAIISFAALFVLCIAFSYFCWIMGNICLDSSYSYGWETLENLDYDQAMLAWQWITIVLCFVFCLVNYTIAYFRFKENEIISRW